MAMPDSNTDFLLTSLKVVWRHLRRFGFHRRSIRHIRGVENKIFFDPCQMNQVVFDIAGDHNKILIGKNCLLNKVRFHVRGNHHTIKIDEHVSFRDQGSVLWLAGDGCEIEIGRGTSFEQTLLAATEKSTKISIGRDCMFAHEIELRTSDAHSIIDENNRQRINPAKDICVEDHVWVGKRAFILKGVTIGRNSVVAIGSVVTKDVPAGTVVGGGPAVPIRSGVTWIRERIV